MPQFDFHNVFWPQLFWLAVFFVVLYFGIVRLTLPRLGRVIDERAAKIDGDLEAARKAKREADEISENVAAEMQRTRETALAQIGEAKTAAVKARETRISAADAEAAQKIDAAQQRIAEARDKAHASLRVVAAESAHAIVVKLTRQEPTADEVSRAVDTAMAS